MRHGDQGGGGERARREEALFGSGSVGVSNESYAQTNRANKVYFRVSSPRPLGHPYARVSCSLLNMQIGDENVGVSPAPMNSQQAAAPAALLGTTCLGGIPR